MPLDWAQTQYNLGNAVVVLADREGGTGRLEEAVVAYRAALQELTRERVPLQWAMTQENLTRVFSLLAIRVAGEAKRKYLTDALTAVDGALAVYRENNAAYYVKEAERLRAMLRTVILAEQGRVQTP